MFCVIALIVFAFLGIFSATHRELAKEAFDCVFRKITLRPCNTDFKEKMKGRIVGNLLNRSVFFARVFNRHFELLSWIFFILTIASTFWVARGLYNYYYYASCNGLNVSGFCAFDPAGENNKVSEVEGLACGTVKPEQENLTLDGVDLSLFPKKITDSENTLVFIGCYSCDYTRSTYPIIQELLRKRQINFVFAHYPAKSGTEYMSAIGYCSYKEDQDKFWKLNDLLFASSKDEISDPEFVYGLLSGVGLDPIEIKACTNRTATKTAIETELAELKKTGIYGTPTIFVNDTAIVGPKPERVYRLMLH